MFDATPSDEDDGLENAVAMCAVDIDPEGVASITYGYLNDEARRALVHSLMQAAADIALGEDDETIH